LDIVFLVDGAVFPLRGGVNPSLTIMASALRNATKNFGNGADHLGRDREEGPS
jgi:choline dehydrogenase-like flavoprotein